MTPAAHATAHSTPAAPYVSHSQQVRAGSGRVEPPGGAGDGREHGEDARCLQEANADGHSLLRSFAAEQSIYLRRLQPIAGLRPAQHRRPELPLADPSADSRRRHTEQLRCLGDFQHTLWGQQCASRPSYDENGRDGITKWRRLIAKLYEKQEDKTR